MSGPNIQFMGLKQQANILGDSIQKAITRVIEHGQFIMGPEVDVLEKKIAEYTDTRFIISCSSGTDALLIALLALEVGPGDLVFTPSFSFVAAVEVIALLGATPVFVEIDPDTFNLDPISLEQEIISCKIKGRGNPKCIIPVDIFGLPADYEMINTVAKKHNLKVIEDCAQGFGGKQNKTKACNLADIGTTSFFPAKPLGCYGDGGAVFTNDEALANRVSSIRHHGKGQQKYEHLRIGVNGRLDTIQAAILIEKLSVFDKELAARKNLAAYYEERLKDTVICQKIPASSGSARALFPIVSDDREKIMGALAKQNIPYAVYYPTPLHLQQAYLYLGHQPGDFLVTEDLCNRILCIPFHPYLSKESAEFVCQTILSALNLR